VLPAPRRILAKPSQPKHTVFINRFPGKDYKKLHLHALSREIQIIWEAVSHPKTRFQRNTQAKII
jgi:hypothetical protein